MESDRKLKSHSNGKEKLHTIATKTKHTKLNYFTHFCFVEYMLQKSAIKIGATCLHGRMAVGRFINERPEKCVQRTYGIIFESISM